MEPGRLLRGRCQEPAVALDEAVQDEAGKTLRDLLTRYGPEAVKLLD